MADNVLLNAGTGGDTMSADDLGAFKVQRVKVQYGADGSATDVSATTPMPVQHSNGTQNMPTGDAVARAIQVRVSDGTNAMPSMDAVGRPGFVKVTDGTNTQPTGDNPARALYVRSKDPAGAFFKTGSYTTQQTSTTIWTPTSGKRVVVTSISVTARLAGTTAGEAQLYFGAGAYVEGTNQPVVAQIPLDVTASQHPGFALGQCEIFANAVDLPLKITTSAAVQINVSISGYEV